MLTLLKFKRVLGGLFLSLTLFTTFSFGAAALGSQVITVTTVRAVDPATDNTPVLGGINQILGKMGEVLSFFDVGGKLGELVGNIIGLIMQKLAEAIGGTSASPNYKTIQGALPPPQTIDDFYSRYGALGALGFGVENMYANPPVTTADYLATIHPIAPANAFNLSITGRQVLTPMQPWWETARNFAYIFFVVILVVIGLMIMFRSRIDPRTTVTVTAALPNLIVSLVLITFSLAFAGLIIDIGRIFMGMFWSLIHGSLANNKPMPGLSGTGDDILGNLLTPWGIWQAFVFNGNVGSFGGFGGTLAGILIRLIVFVFSFYVGFMVFITLLFRYINLITKPIFAPIVFLFGALPGRGGAISSWFKGYLVDALTFPLVFLVLALALSIRNVSDNFAAGQDPFGLFAGGTTSPFFSFFNGMPNLNALVSLGVMLFATKIPALLEEALDVKPSGHVERAGASPEKMIKNVPIIKSFF